jgi:hypothetical protein
VPLLAVLQAGAQGALAMVRLERRPCYLKIQMISLREVP